MKKVLAILIVLVCLGGMILATGCSGEKTQQQKFDKAAAQEMSDYTFAFAATETELAAVPQEDADRYVAWTTKTTALRQGEEADKYIVCTDSANQTSLVYLYTDICYDESKSYRYFDMYTPVPKENLDPDTPVFLYLHGGGWVAGSRKDESLSLMPYLVKAGFVVFSMEYALWFGMNQRKGIEKGVYKWTDVGNALQVMDIIFQSKITVSVADMMNDVETCLSYLKDTQLPALGLNAQTIGIGGYSAGGHLSSLYAYKYADQSPIPLAFELDLVGPVRLLDEGYLHVVSLLLGKNEEGKAIKTDDLLVKTVVKLFRSDDIDISGMLQGILGYYDQPIDITTDDGWALAEELIAQWQGYTFLDENSIPTVICYAKSHPESAKIMENFFPDDFDLFIPITVYYSMSAKLDEVGIVHADHLYEEMNHNTIGKETESCKWMAQQCRAMAQLYCR